MERDPSFDFNPRRRRESIPSYEEISEYLRDPENVRELLLYWNYLRAVQNLIPRGLELRVQEAVQRELHTAVDRASNAYPAEDQITAHAPVVPRGVTLPPPGTVLHVGEHMNVTLGYSAAASWPDANKASFTLTDGKVVTPTTSIGVIDYYRNIPRLNTDGNLITFSRVLITSAAESLQQLARRYEEMGTRARALEAFSGMSHLARLAHRFGFTVFPIADAGERRRATNTSLHIASAIGIDNVAWQQVRDNYKPAQVAMISSTELVRRYGGNPL